MKPHKGMAKLAKWKAVPTEEASERFGLDEADDIYNIALEDIFGDTPENVFLCEGKTTVDGNIAVGSIGDYAGVYIVDGDLEINGVCDFSQCDGGCVLYVTGNLRAKTFGVDQEAQLWVGKDLVCENLLIAGISDAGGIAVRGKTTAKAVIVTSRGAAIKLGKGWKGRVIHRSESNYLDKKAFPKVETAEGALAKPFATEDVNYRTLMKAAIKGASILAS